MGRVAFFDLDHTLLDVNSGHLWAREEWRRGRLGVSDVLKVTWVFLRYGLGAEDLDDAMYGAARLYEGIPEAQLAAEIGAWFDRDLAHRARPGALTALRAHREAGDTCVLATSSTQFSAACAVRTWGLDDAVSTVIEVDDDGILTGDIAVMGLGAHKLGLCRAWAARAGHDLAQAAFYTDSYSDLPLLAEVGEPVAVHPDRRLRAEALARGWPIARWGTATAP